MRCRSRALVMLALLTIAPWLAAPPARAEDAAFTAAQRAEIVAILRDALTKDPSILRDALAALQSDEAAKQDAASRAAIARDSAALVGTPGDPQAGNPVGGVTVVEFYDLRCPFCRRMLPVVAELLRDDPGIRLIYKDIPILGAASVLGARAVLAARQQGGYQRLHDAIMAASPDITPDSLHAAASEAGLDWDRLRHDMDDPAIMTRITANLALAHDLGLDGTPVYVIGTRMLAGAVELDELKGAVAAARAP